MSILTPPRIIFDTMIFTDAACGALGKMSQTVILPSDWAKAVNYVNRNYTHAATPTTVVELLTSLWNADAEHFPEQCVRLQKLQRSFANTVFLTWLGPFIRAEVFGLEANVEPGIKYDFRALIESVLESNTKAAAGKRVPFQGLAAQRQTDKDDWRAQVAEHQRIAKNKKGPPLLNSRGWAEQKLGELGIEATDSNCEIFRARLDCMYHVECRILELAQNPSWNLDELHNFIFDQNQTGYLGGENVFFVTRDTNTLKASKKSTQKDRVYSWTDFLSRC
jgi:hypothetical protein